MKVYPYKHPLCPHAGIRYWMDYFPYDVIAAEIEWDFRERFDETYKEAHRQFQKAIANKVSFGAPYPRRWSADDEIVHGGGMEFRT